MFNKTKILRIKNKKWALRQAISCKNSGKSENDIIELAIKFYKYINN